MDLTRVALSQPVFILMGVLDPVFLGVEFFPNVTITPPTPAPRPMTSSGW